MKKVDFLSIILFAIISLNSSFAQNQPFQNWLKDFQDHHARLPTEKVFLHLDKSEYTLGETIWMKSYLVAGSGHTPSPLSKNLYVELVDEEGQIVKRLNLLSNEGLSKASLVLQKEWSSGFYYLRAYTNWMKNQKSDFFFNKKIKVHSLKEGDFVKEKVVSQALEIGFYPEGGEMIKGIMGKVAFEVSGISEQKLPVSGKIFNSNHEEVTTFKTTHEGKGIFVMLPADDHYYAQLDGFESTFNLPEVQHEGVAMSVNNQSDDYMNVVIKTEKQCSDVFYLLAHTRGYITYASEIRLRGTRGFARINKSTLPDGISHITLFDQDMSPLAERLAFIHPEPELKVTVSPGNTGYTTRDLATITLEVKDKLGNPVQGSFSMSVFDATLVQNDQVDYNINTHMLLSSDLLGYVKNPSQYLKQDDTSRSNADLLMMVNGWRRFKWEDISRSETEPLYAFEQSLTLEGQMSKPNGNAIKDGRVFLLNDGKSNFVLADEDGNFQFENLTFYDTTDLVLQGFQKNRIKNVSFKIKSDYERLPLNKFYTDAIIDNPARVKALKEYAITSIKIDSTYRKMNGIIYLDDVYVTANKREERYRTLNSQYGKGEAYINFDKIPYEEKNGRDPFTVMLGKLAGFSLSNASGGMSSSGMSIGNSGTAGTTISSGGTLGAGAAAIASNRFTDYATENDPMFRKPTLRQGPYQGSPLILIDNVPVPYSAVYDLRATDVDYVEVYKSGSAAMFGVNGFNGAIAIYTLKGDKMFRDRATRLGMDVISANGYHAAREFYAPKYDDSNQQKFIPDERATLFWAPMITTDSEGKAQVEFYTHDKNTNVFIDVQGISKNGKTGTGVAQFNIRKNL